jgi:CII-binding regulator of phage lambda lysogenization HflD
MPTPREPERIVDMRIPLHWMLSTAGAILVTLCITLWNIAGQSNKLDQLIIANAKLEKRLDDRDVRVDALRDRISAVERATDALAVRVDNIERTTNHK